jgi:predicted HTH domain antitoxin
LFKEAEIMAETKFERIEIDLPRDVIFAMRQLQRPEEVKRKVKVALALLLFQERTISLGKAVELSEMSRVKFMEVLKDHDIPAYEYDDRDFQRDQETVAKYRETPGK